MHFFPFFPLQDRPSYNSAIFFRGKVVWVLGWNSSRVSPTKPYWRTLYVGWTGSEKPLIPSDPRYNLTIHQSNIADVHKGWKWYDKQREKSWCLRNHWTSDTWSDILVTFNKLLLPMKGMNVLCWTLWQLTIGFHSSCVLSKTWSLEGHQDQFNQHV